jgi:2-keto-4-pentenoate hydratase/2-oxohepta-3-ene-1,7-dioic acid hydratase in catechol pathway
LTTATQGPPRFLARGDRVRIEIVGIGALEHRII